MQESLELAVRELEESSWRSQACSGEVRIQGSEGRVVLRLGRLACLECGVSFRPAEAFLAYLEGANVSGKLREAALLAGSSWPYKTAARVLGTLSGAEISHETVRQVTIETGQAEVGRQLAGRHQTLVPNRLTLRMIYDQLSIRQRMKRRAHG
jgi:hypothetical protein